MSPFRPRRWYLVAKRRTSSILPKGVFDDCQDVVMGRIERPGIYKREFKSARSIPINLGAHRGAGGVLLQGYFAATKSNDQKVSFAVPPAISAMCSQATLRA